MGLRRLNEGLAEAVRLVRSIFEVFFICVALPVVLDSGADKEERADALRRLARIECAVAAPEPSTPEPSESPEDSYLPAIPSELLSEPTPVELPAAKVDGF